MKDEPKSKPASAFPLKTVAEELSFLRKTFRDLVGTGRRDAQLLLERFDAKNFFALPTAKKAPFRRNQFGFSLGGPVKTDKTHFFGTYEGLRENLGRTITSTTPDLNARDGRLCDANGANCAAAAIKPEVKPYLDLFPLPNGEALGGGLARFRWAFQQITNVDFFQVRLDHQQLARAEVQHRGEFTGGVRRASVSSSAVAQAGHGGNAILRTWRRSCAWRPFR